MENKKLERLLLILAIIIFALSIIPRFYDIMKFLPSYSVDENEIVENGVAFLGGDLEPYWYKYGPLYAYILSIIFGIISLFSGSETNVFLQKIFFDPTVFYFIARFVNSLINVLLALITYKTALKFFNRKIALIALCIVLFPFSDLLSNFKIRVDTLLALWTQLTLFYLLMIVQKGEKKNYRLAGIFWGLSIATKPLAAMLILPTIFLAHLFSFVRISKLTKPVESKKKNKKKVKTEAPKESIPVVILKAIFASRFWLLLGFAVLANFLANPYSLLRFNAFWKEQIFAITTEGGRQFTAGWDLTRFFNNIGVVYVVVSVLAVGFLIYRTIRKKDKVTAILLSYILFFWLAFAKGAARDYFYIPIIPPMGLLIGVFYFQIKEKLPQKELLRNITILLMIILLLFQPASKLMKRSILMNSSSDYRKLHSELSSKKWIEENLKAGSRILMYGFYTSLPKLIDFRAENQAQYGEYFMYYRWNFDFFNKLFQKAHRNYLMQKRPVYELYLLRNALNEKQLEQLADYIQQNKIDYFITYKKMPDKIGFKENIIKEFTKEDYPFGKKITIYGFSKED